MTNETTPDAVEQAIASLVNVLVNECSHTSETASALDVCLANLRHARHAERARHAEEVARLRDVHLDETRALDDLRLKEIASLRDQLRKVEGEREEVLRMIDGLRKSEKTAREYINMRLRDEAQAENVQLKAERDSLRALLPDVRECAEYCRNMIGPPPWSARRGLSVAACGTCRPPHPRSPRFPGRGGGVPGLDEFDSPRDITHVHRMGPIRGPEETT